MWASTQNCYQSHLSVLCPVTQTQVTSSLDGGSDFSDFSSHSLLWLGALLSRKGEQPEPQIILARSQPSDSGRNLLVFHPVNNLKASSSSSSAGLLNLTLSFCPKFQGPLGGDGGQQRAHSQVASPQRKLGGVQRDEVSREKKEVGTACPALG